MRTNTLKFSENLKNSYAEKITGFKPVFLFRKGAKNAIIVVWKRSKWVNNGGKKVDVNELINQLITPVGQVALVMALAELFKRCGCDSKYIPIVDVVLGLISGLGVFCLMLHYSVIESVILGLAIGLSACGLFSGVKNITQDVNVNKGDENHG